MSGLTTPLFPSATPLRTEEQQPPLESGIGHEAEQIAHLTQQLRLKTEQVLEMGEARIRLLAAISHDLSQPTHAIGLLCDRAVTETNPIRLKHDLHDLKELSQSLSTSLTTLMDLTRLEAGLVKAKLEPVLLRELLLSLEVEFAGAARKRGLILNVPYSQLWVHTDSVLLHGLLAHLVSNAIKYTHSGQVNIELQEEAGSLVLAVRDTGMGIRSERLDLIFKDFVHRNDADDAGLGLGLGLSIVSRYAALMDHPLSVSSVEQQGSCFSIRLPLVQDLELPVSVPLASLDQPDAQAPMQAATGGDARLTGLRVMVVDNEDLVLSSMDKTLSAWGCKVFGASCLAEARELAQHEALDLVISDLHLGDTEPNGLTLIHALRVMQGRTDSASQHLLPALLMTGDISGQPQAQAERAQVGMLYKPVRPSVLQSTLLDLLPQIEQGALMAAAASL